MTLGLRLINVAENSGSGVMKFPTCAAILLMTATTVGHAQSPCGREGPSCRTPLGTYRLALPDTTPPAGGYPAVIFFHGAGGSGTGTLKMSGMIRTFTGNGIAVIAPDGLKRPDSRFGPGWSFLPSRPQHRDELAFTRSLIQTAQSHGIDPGRITLSGFSIGGSLVWYLACKDHRIGQSYAPVAGAFWRPHPAAQDCTGPVRMLHTHGWRDRTVPLEGRPLRSGQIYQGDVHHGLAVLRDLNGCDQLRADAFDTQGPFWRRIWTRCTSGTPLEFALHPGGHSVPKGWAEMVVAWLKDQGT